MVKNTEIIFLISPYGNKPDRNADRSIPAGNRRR